MEFINEFILLSFQIKEELDSSYYFIKKDKEYIYLTFNLNSKDCLIDLDGNNYQIFVRVANTYFERYNEDFNIDIEQQSICCNLQLKIWEIIKCNLTGISRKLFLESQILFLLCRTQKDGLTSGCSSCEFSNKNIELEKIQLARKYILENLENNLTIPIIANNIGTNECYLKKGFKEVFNQTIFEFIQENRMVKAKHLLENRNLSITEVAFNVGYSSLSSFSQAYKNYYGISPTDYIKQITNFPNN